MQSDLWAVPLHDQTWEDIDFQQAEVVEAAARKRLRSPRRFYMEDFQWTGRPFIEAIRVGHRVLQCTTERDGRVLVSPPARVIAVRRYVARGGKQMVVCLEVPRTARRMSEEEVIRRIGPGARHLMYLAGARRLRDEAVVYALGQLWASKRYAQ